MFTYPNIPFNHASMSFLHEGERNTQIITDIKRYELFHVSDRWKIVEAQNDKGVSEAEELRKFIKGV